MGMVVGESLGVLSPSSPGWLELISNTDPHGPSFSRRAEKLSQVLNIASSLLKSIRVTFQGCQTILVHTRGN